MHSAIVAPKEMTRILLHFSPSCDNGIEFVTTSSSISDLFNLSIAGPDVGGVVRSRALAKQLNDADLAIIDKRRAAANQSEVMNIIGDIEGKVCIVPDDIIDTAGTLCNAAKALKDHGAAGVKAYITHPVLSGPSI